MSTISIGSRILALDHSSLHDPTSVLSSSLDTLSDLLVSYLRQLDINRVFGIPGGTVEPLYNAFAKERDANSDFKIVTSRHETGSAFMAEGYYLATGRLGVCCATSGPGATNLITGVASADVNKIPMLVITGQSPLEKLGHGSFQDSSCTGTNTLSIFESCTRYNSLISHPNQFEIKLRAAIISALGNNPGPVHLSIPTDILASKHHNFPQHFLPDALPTKTTPTKFTIEKLKDKLDASKNIVFIVDQHAAEGITEILQMASIVDAKIVSTPNGKGLISHAHPNYYGIIGFSGHQSAKNCVSESQTQTIVAIGCNFTEWSQPPDFKQRIETKEFIQIDEIESNFLLSPKLSFRIDGNIKAIFQGLLALYDAPKEHSVLPTNKNQITYQEIMTASNQQIHPATLMQKITEFLPANSRYFPDTGNSFSWALHYLNPPEKRINGLRNQRLGLFKTTVNFAAMGWAIGVSVGAAMGCDKSPTVCITGDGSFLMNGQEISVAREHHLPVVFIILNDYSLGMVKHGQRLTGAAPIAHEIPQANYMELAKAMKITALRIQTEEDLQQLQSLNYTIHSGPLLLDVLIDPEATPPIFDRTDALRASAKQETKAHADQQYLPSEAH